MSKILTQHSNNLSSCVLHFYKKNFIHIRSHKVYILKKLNDIWLKQEMQQNKSLN
jgi:hypothetical protein